MKKIKIILLPLLLIFIIVCVCSKNCIKSTNDIENKEKYDWSTLTPLDFLEKLKYQGNTWVTIWNNPPNDWIKEEHIHELIKHIESKEKSAFVVSALSSYLPSGSSAVGDEAMYLINGYRNKKYPPSLYSGPGNPEEIIEWYKKWTKENKSP